jgi:hypothetical protein
MYFGYQAHRYHGLGWRQPRSGRQMQQDPGYPLRWDRLKREAYSNGELYRLIDASQRHGVAEIRRRKVALDRSRG